MKKIFFLLCLFLNFHCWGQNVPVIEMFQSIEINPDESITVIKYGTNNKKVIKKGEKEKSVDRHHSISILYKGIEDGKIVFEKKRVHSFRGKRNEKTEIKKVMPYTETEYCSSLPELCLSY